MADYRKKMGQRSRKRQTGANLTAPGGGGGDGDSTDGSGGGSGGGDTSTGSGDNTSNDSGTSEGNVSRKPAYVTTITTSRQTISEGQFVDVQMTLKAPNADTVYAGDLVVEVDGKTVHQEEVHVGREDLSITLPVRLTKKGEHKICATLVEPTDTNIPLEDI